MAHGTMTVYLFASVWLALTASAFASGRKNVLYILADDMRADWGAYGLPVQTPNLDKSLRPDTNKVWNFIDANPMDTQAIPGHFRNNGYLSLGLGKTFHEDGGAWNADAYWNTTARPYYQYKVNTCPHGGEGGGHCILPDDDIWDYQLRLASVEALKYAANYFKNTSTPFFLMTGFRDPHAPWAAPARMYALYNDSEIQPAKHDALGKDTPLIAWSHQLAVMLSNGTEFEYSYDSPVPVWVMQDQRHAYYAAISYVDEHVGALLEVLEDQNIVNDTIVVFHADHGYGLGEHGYWEKKANFDMIVRVPFVIKVPGVTDQPNYTHSTPALLDLVDTFPTLSTLAGLPHPVGVDGVDQANVVLQNLHDAKHSALARNASFHQYPACGMSVINMTRSQCNNVPANQFDYMGYSIRTLEARYTAWFPWNRSSLSPIVSGEYAAELYLHDGDNSTSFDDWENTNMVKLEPALANAMHAKLLDFFMRSNNSVNGV